MFQKKQIIYSETIGVCQVDNIIQLSAKKGEGVPYYVLKSIKDSSKIAYIPVDNHQVVLRELFMKEEAEKLKDTPQYRKDEKLKEAVEYVLEEEVQHGTAAGDS